MTSIMSVIITGKLSTRQNYILWKQFASASKYLTADGLEHDVGRESICIIIIFIIIITTIFVSLSQQIEAISWTLVHSFIAICYS